MRKNNNQRFRILVVDDDATILDLYKRILTPDNPLPSMPAFEVICCTQGDEAVDAVKKSLEEHKPFAVSFLDLNMPPGPDGQWTADQFQKLDPAINIVMVTGYRSTEVGCQPSSSNFSDKLLYLQKPFYRQEIIQFSTALSIKWQAERQLLDLHADLEGLVEKRTAELVQSNKLLKNEIENRRQIQEKLEQSFQNLKKVMDATIQAIAMTVEKRDPYTSGHQMRVAALTRAISQDLEFTEDQVEGAYVAASIHDIGKISLPAEILSKPIQLTEIEMSLIQAHAQAGFDILKGIDFPWPIAEIIIQHHERMDGSGYPRGLAGDDILMEARVIGVADVVETMASHRPYRPSMGIDKALAEITQNSGTLYDPDVVAACLKIFRDGSFAFPS
jgi:HD-GYP domain-containing protein (c-di-GMP phosphodiesterase class II)